MSARGVNKVILLGRVGKDPEVRYTPSGDAIANFSLATTETWKDKRTGEPQEQTEWHRVVAFGRVAGIVGEYVKKGDQLYVEGSIRTRKYQDRDKVDRYVTEIRLADMQMLGGKRDAGGPPARNGIAGSGLDQAYRKPDAGSDPEPLPTSAFDDDIPF